MIALLLLGTALATPIGRVVPADRELGVPLGDHWVPRDSTVHPNGLACGEGEQGVRVVAVDPWYRQKGVQVVEAGHEGCLALANLQDNAEVVGSPQAEESVKAAHRERFGPLDDAAVKSTPWGRIALPMFREFSATDLQAEQVREGLVTQKQKERVVVAEGPHRNGTPVYAHFLGSDAPRSDRWATPATILQLMALSDEWATHCRRTLPQHIPEANPETCLLQIGDLGWYNDTLPDPLGHRDHYRGTCVDIRLFRTVASRYEAWWNRPDDRPSAKGGYSQPLTLAFLRFAIETAKVTNVHFNDPVVREALPGVTAARGHDDHIHMCFEGG